MNKSDTNNTNDAIAVTTPVGLQAKTGIPWQWLVAFLLTAGTLLGAGVAYPFLPERIPTHWNFSGEIDGYGSRWTLFLVPMVSLLMMGLFAAIPWLSPKDFKVSSELSVMRSMMLIIVALFSFMAVVVIISAAWAAPPTRLMIAGMCIFLGLLGNLLGKVERNFFIGVRTPWTLASPRVWIDTHRLAAWLSVLGAGIGFVLVFVPGAPVWMPLVVVLSTFVYPVFHSLILYKQLEKRGELDSPENLATPGTISTTPPPSVQ